MRSRELFGQVAIHRGHITPMQLEETLDIQKSRSICGSEELLGMVMLDEGIISNEQLIDILRCMETTQSRKMELVAGIA